MSVGRGGVTANGTVVLTSVANAVTFSSLRRLVPGFCARGGELLHGCPGRYYTATQQAAAGLPHSPPSLLRNSLAEPVLRSEPLCAELAVFESNRRRARGCLPACRCYCCSQLDALAHLSAASPIAQRALPGAPTRRMGRLSAPCLLWTRAL
jgi:hypothetical protein